MGYFINIIFFNFLLDIFFIYISNTTLKVPYTLAAPCSSTHPLMLPGPGIPLYWGIWSSQDQEPLLPLMAVSSATYATRDTVLGELLVSSYCCSPYRIADPFSSLGTFSSSSIGGPVLHPIADCASTSVFARPQHCLTRDSYIGVLSAKSC